jgi:hypothetical protein
MKNLIPYNLFEMSKFSFEEYRDVIYNFYKYCDDNFYDDIDTIDPQIIPELSFTSVIVTHYNDFRFNKPKMLYEILTEHPFLDLKIKFDIIYKTDKSDIRTYCEMTIRNSMFYFDDEDQNKTSIHRLKDVKKYYDIMFNKIKEQING